MSRWKIVGKSRPPKPHNGSSSSEHHSDPEGQQSRKQKWSLGMLQDPETDEVPGKSSVVQSSRALHLCDLDRVLTNCVVRLGASDVQVCGAKRASWSPAYPCTHIVLLSPLATSGSAVFVAEVKLNRAVDEVTAAFDEAHWRRKDHFGSST